MAVPELLHLSSERGLRGGERQLLLLARGLGPLLDHQTLAAPAGSPLLERAGSVGVAPLPLVPRPTLHPANLLRLLGWLRRHPRAILHAHTSPALALVALVRRLTPVGAVVHTRRVAYPLRRAAKYRSAADRYVAISQAIAGQLLAAGLEPSRLSVIPSAVDLDAIDSLPPTPELTREVDRPLVGCVAELSREKGHRTLLEAWATVLRELPAPRLVLLGDGPERPHLERLAGHLPAGTVLLAGHREDVPAWLKRLDLYVQPSLAEGLGSSTLEAMACRLAVVASRTGGLPEAVEDGVTGRLVPPGEASRLAAAVVDLLRDPERARRFGAAGRARVETRFAAAAMVERYLELYRDLAADG